MFPVDPLLQKVNRLLGKDYTHRTHLETILDLTLLIEQQQKELIESQNRELSYIDDIETYQLQETLLLERLKKITIEYKGLKRNSRSIRFFEMAEENLKMAQELALLKGELSG